MATLNARKLNLLSQEELKALLTEQGADIPYEALKQAQAYAESTIELPVPPAERSQNKFYKGTVAASRFLTEAFSIAQIAFIQGIAAPLMTVLLAYVEWDRVRAGIAQFDATHADLLAAVSIIAYIVLTVIQAHHETQYQEKRQKEVWNVRKGLRDLRAFFIGQPRSITETDEIRKIITILRWLIVISASFSSLQGQFESTGAISFEEVINTVTGDFRIATGVVIVGLLALSLLQGLHWSLFRIFEITTNLVGGVEVGDNRNFLAEQQRVLHQRQQLGLEAQRMHMIGLILEHQRQLKLHPIPEQTPLLNSSETSETISGTFPEEK